jgi:hypothetical protein
MVSKVRTDEQRAYDRARYVANREAALARAKECYAAKREEKLAYVRAYREKNREEVIAKQRERYHATKDVKREAKNATARDRYRVDRERLLARSKASHYANREKRLEQKRIWSAANKHRHAHYSATRRAAILRATPGWADLDLVAEAYELAHRRTEATGIEWEVDHHVPLVGRLATGLHVIENLRVIPRGANRSKSNSFDPLRAGPQSFLY